MKKLLLLAFAAATLASCSDDDNNGSPSVNEMTLKKTETYYPTKAIYDSGASNGYARKDVTWYQNNIVVADSTFDLSNNLIGHTQYNYTPNTTTITTYTNSTTWYSTYVYTYDAQGRVAFVTTQMLSSQYTGDGDLIAETEGEFTYGTGTVTFTSFANSDTGQDQYQYVYALNNFGVINALQSGPGSIASVSMNDDQPLSLSYDLSENTFNFTYYAIPLPANFIKTPKQLNNLVLTNESNLFALATEGNYYIQSHNYINFDKQFNSQDYITYDKATGIYAEPGNPDYFDESSYERFFYYN